MMPAHYIIFHPDSQRETVEVTATALRNGRLVTNWLGSVDVDLVGNTNEDPYVFNEPWIYSYCHASQLRRVQTTNNHLALGSWLFFVSGDWANADFLAFDTVFRVGAVQPWLSSGSAVVLPEKYQFLLRQKSHDLYQRHFKWPVEEALHSSVSHSYEADLWERGKQEYSFLPLDQELGKATLHFRALGPRLASNLRRHVYGKRPVPLTIEEAQIILTNLNSITQLKVVRDIRLVVDRVLRLGKKHC